MVNVVGNNSGLKNSALAARKSEFISSNKRKNENSIPRNHVLTLVLLWYSKCVIIP